MVTEKGYFLVRTGLILKLNEGQKKQIHSPLLENKSKLSLTQSLSGAEPTSRAKGEGSQDCTIPPFTLSL